ncbi:MAG TPA: hypothetical protein VE592_11715, partial [Geminicoccaceae bacterium]|nr:hypothetical protein [Geminicoccaceae bacterium]
MAQRYTKQDVLDTAERLKNWGRWGPDDQIGAVNFVTAEDIVSAPRLVRRGKVFPLGLPLDQKGPQAGLWGGRDHRGVTPRPHDAARVSAARKDESRLRY